MESIINFLGLFILIASFIVSFTGWWGALLLITWHITQ